MKNLSIHIVEDEIIIALDMEDLLEDMGHQVNVSYTLQDALEKIPQSTCDLFLVDIHLQGADSGIDLGKELHDRKIPHIYISAYADSDTLKLAEATDSIGYLQKPFNERDFRKLLKNASIRISNDDR